jgi:hypothetical protein
MRRLLNVLVLVAALNFLAVAGAATWLVRAAHVDRQKLIAIGEVLFPKPPAPEVTLATEEPPASQPSQKLAALLDEKSGRTAAEQVEFIQRTIDAQLAQMDRRQRDLEDMQRQVELARQQTARDRAALERDRLALASLHEQTAQLQSDQGFQDSLELYQGMPARQVKTIFMTLEDATVRRYLEAMAPRKAASILREFKTPEELARVQQVLEAMRTASASPATAPSATDSPSASTQ